MVANNINFVKPTSQFKNTTFTANGTTISNSTDLLFGNTTEAATCNTSSNATSLRFENTTLTTTNTTMFVVIVPSVHSADDERTNGTDRTVLPEVNAAAIARIEARQNKNVLTITFKAEDSEAERIQIDFSNGRYPDPKTGMLIDLPGPLQYKGNGPLGQSTQVILPAGFSGTFHFGNTGSHRQTKVEASLQWRNGVLVSAINVSYVDGYSYPSTCTCDEDGEVIAGCNIDLFATNRCPDHLADGSCANPNKDTLNWATPFFRPCQGASYTFPNDDGATADGFCPSNKYTCHIGRGAPPSRLQTNYVARE
jgi:hypothetical protein